MSSSVYVSNGSYLVFVVFIFSFLNYLYCALGCYNLLCNRKMKNKFLAFIPIVNSTYVVGSISDSINNDYFKETNSNVSLFLLKFVELFSISCLFVVLFFKTPNFRSEIIGWLMSDSFRILNLINIISKNTIAFIIFLFSVAISILFIVYKLMAYYNIFLEYGGKFKLVFFIFFILSYFIFRICSIHDIFIFIVSKHKSKFKELNEPKIYI